MSWIRYYMNRKYLSRRVLHIGNEHGDEVEMVMTKYKDQWLAIATICPDEPPFKDYSAEGVAKSERGAAREALIELYQQAYSK
ncbi:MAG: hypothetical protein ACQEWW_18965 [Bacillota bacterium]